MKKIFLTIILFYALFAHSLTSSYASQGEKSYEGYWVYGFETSLFESCDGELYWMFVPWGFTGKYQMEGHRNPVRVTGYLSPPNPDENMYSKLEELVPTKIRHAIVQC